MTRQSVRIGSDIGPERQRRRSRVLASVARGGLRRRPRLLIRDDERNRGIHFVAGSGSGKSLVIGSIIAARDCREGIPQVLFDPHGPMIDAFLLRISCLPKSERRSVWRRILYIDMSGRGEQSASFPLLFELGGETRQDIADRFLATCQALDPHLQSASIQGWNALKRIGRQVGVILASLGLQLDAALDLLDHPEAWGSRLDEAVARYPEAASAAAFFREKYLPASPGKRAEMTASYRTKIEEIQLDPTMRDMFCRTPAAVDWHRVTSERLTVLLDFRGETNSSKRIFKTRAVYDYVLSFVRHRGPGVHVPLAIHIDELTELTNAQSLDHDLFAHDLDNLFNVLMRNYNLWVTAAHQEMWQVSEKTQKTLLSMGTQIIGVTSDMESAQRLAHHFVPLDPRRVKRLDRIWASERIESLTPLEENRTEHVVIDEREINWSLDEQLYMASRAFIRLHPFEYLVRRKGGHNLIPVSTTNLVGTPWPSDYSRLLAEVRRRLARRTGVDILLNPKPTSAEPSATMYDDKTHETDNDDEQLDPLYWRS